MSSSFSGTLRARSVTRVSGRITSWQMATTSIIAESVQAGQKRPGPVTLLYARRRCDRVTGQVLTGSLLNGFRKNLRRPQAQSCG